MSEIFNYCHVAELTDKGCKRAVNEDNMIHFDSPNGLVAVVCDGMGGHAGGQIASQTAIHAIQQFMMQPRSGTPNEQIVDAMNAANAAILHRAVAQPELAGMGSTCVMLIVRNGKVYIGSVGDSRVYLIRSHNIRQLTVDQSYVQMLVDAGTITAEQAGKHPRRNEITNALGLADMTPATVLPHSITPLAGDCFLLCSDGLSGMVSDEEICRVVSRQSEKTQQERVEELIFRAKQKGGLDNITCQIVEFSVTPGQTDNFSFKWKHSYTQVAAVVLSALLLWGLWCLWRHINPPSPPVEKTQDTIQPVDSVVVYLKEIPRIKDVEFLRLTEEPYFNGFKLEQKDTLVAVKAPLLLKDMVIDSFFEEFVGIEKVNPGCWILKWVNVPDDPFIKEFVIRIQTDTFPVYHFILRLEPPQMKNNRVFPKKGRKRALVVPLLPDTSAEPSFGHISAPEDREEIPSINDTVGKNEKSEANDNNTNR